MAVAAESMFNIALTQTGLVLAALAFSIWAALSSHSQARTARQALEESERPHLLIHFSDTGAQSLLWGTDMVRPTKLVFHNYAKSPGYIRAYAVQFSRRTEEEGYPPPFDWRRATATIAPFGAIVAPEGDSHEFEFDARDDVPPEEAAKIDYNKRRWFMQGVLLYGSMSRLGYVYGFAFRYEDGEWRIGEPDFRQGDEYNWNRRWTPGPVIDQLRRWTAEKLRSAAEAIAPKN